MCTGVRWVCKSAPSVNYEKCAVHTHPKRFQHPVFSKKKHFNEVKVKLGVYGLFNGCGKLQLGVYGGFDGCVWMF